MYSPKLSLTLFLLVVIHASSAWDSSNIWFPDPNNPTFYNLTYYQEAAKAINSHTPTNDRRKPSRPVVDESVRRPTVDDSIRIPSEDESILRPTVDESIRRPTVDESIRRPAWRQTVDESIRRPTVDESIRRPTVDESIRRPTVDESIRRPTVDESIRRPTVDESIRRPTVDESVRRPAAALAKPERTGPVWARVVSSRPRQGVKTNRISGQQNSQNLGSSQDSPIGFRTQYLLEDNAAQLADAYNENNNIKANRQPSRNRLQRRENDGNTAAFRQNFGANQEPVANYDYNRRNVQERNLRQSSQEGRWNGNGNPNFEAANNAIGGGRNVVSNEGNTRNWNNQGTRGSVATNTVEGDLISDIETSSKTSGPSKCVWAIISCCKPSSTEIRYSCFETLGCHGAFWDNNPCSKEMTLAAVQSTANFYNIPAGDN